MRRPVLQFLLRQRPQPRSTTTLRNVQRLRTSLQLRQCGSCAPPAEQSTPAPPKTASSNVPPDHRTIATAQQLLITSPASPGSPLFLPNGTHIYNKLVAFLRAQYAVYGFQEVLTPNIYKRSLWETSGHWENYKEDMFEVSGRGAGGVKDEDLPAGQNEEYGLKPMNCPGHCLMFKATAGSRSIRDLPVRYADFSPLHRNENSGSLSGLTRVRRFHQDDGHIFCRPVQIMQEILSTLNFIESAYKVFHLAKPTLVLSTRPENYIGNIEEWDRAESALKEALEASGQPWTLNTGDGAFYGPKIDVMIQDSDGKRHQTATVQLDFQLPQRFGLEYTAPAPALEQKGLSTADPALLAESGPVTPVIIHRAIMGSLERFMALLIEHYNGKWPFWLSPNQAIIIPVATTPEIMAYAEATRRVIAGTPESTAGAVPLSTRTFAVKLDDSTNSLSKKIRAAKTAGYNHIVVIGERDVAARTISVETRQAQAGTRAKPEEMTAVELYARFRALEDSYA